MAFFLSLLPNGLYESILNWLKNFQDPWAVWFDIYPLGPCRRHAMGRKVIVWSHWNDFNPYQKWQDSLAAGLRLCPRGLCLHESWLEHAVDRENSWPTGFALYRICTLLDLLSTGFALYWICSLPDLLSRTWFMPSWTLPSPRCGPQGNHIKARIRF